MGESAKKSKDYLVTFHTTSDAMRGEKICQQDELKANLQPVPRDISSSCGLALKADDVVLCDLKETFKNSSIDVEGLYLCRGDEFVDLEL